MTVEKFGGFDIPSLLFRRTLRILTTQGPVCVGSGVYAVGIPSAQRPKVALVSKAGRIACKNKCRVTLPRSALLGLKRHAAVFPSFSRQRWGITLMTRLDHTLPCLADRDDRAEKA
jgi:hypothetical protein